MICTYIPRIISNLMVFSEFNQIKEFLHWVKEIAFIYHILAFMPRQPVSHRFAFTFNNDEDIVRSTFRELQSHSVSDSTSMFNGLRYICCGLEKGSATARLHIQGYVELVGRFSVRSVKQNLQFIRGAHFEIAIGDYESNRKYCSKDETVLNEGDDPLFFEWGKAVVQGQRTDLITATEIVRTGGVAQLIESSPEVFVRYARGFQDLEYQFRLRTYRQTVRSKPIVTVLFGESGTGKSAFVEKEAGSDAYWFPRPQNNGQYCLGYDMQENVVIDDYYGWLKWDFLLKLLDRYPVVVNTCGGKSFWNARNIWITSNVCPMRWYNAMRLKGISMKPLWRRIDACWEYREIGIIEAFDPSHMTPVETSTSLQYIVPFMS